ncbi:GMC oxidoreductase [Paenibacillus sedimenti]|uniref:GMC family oxidoreductase N-terminal domain-containing protein n=1 Tax=Paenibacillus sedimenti TaxID=2770274 RepID=A0A926QMU7_9BACL|nr:GMC oxidoreductase [Paenibacillus sedimenti]MBD0384072.1 GMC family oxidoreductase N-terminal domain-containing protein [Paenibacillus sedimenti]
MRIYVADKRDTLRKIAQKFHINLSELITLNFRIPDPDHPLTGIPVYLPLASSEGRAYSEPSFIHVTPAPVSEGSWITISSLEKMSQTEYDVLIVGTGPGGGAVLWRLCEQWRNNGKKIGVVEAGNLLLPTHARNIETMSFQRWIDLAYHSPRFKIPVSGTNFRQLIAVGGRSLVWSGVSPRMYLDPQQWPVPQWEMDMYYRIAEQVMNVSNRYTEGSPINQIFLHQLRNGPYPAAVNGPLAVDLEPTKYGEIHSNVFFSSISFLAKALYRKTYDLAVLARAVQVVTDKKGVAGVHVMTPDKRSCVLKAKTVVLSASTFGTPRILLHSGIRGNAIGHYLINHSAVRGTAKFNRKDYPYVLGPIGILIPETEKLPYQVVVEGPIGYQFYHDKQIPFQEEMDVFVAGFGTVQPRYENKINLDPFRRDEYGVPELQIHLDYNEADKAILQQATDEVKRVTSAIGTPLVSLVPDEPVAGDHEAGTCRMGDDPDTSATDRYGQIHGVPGLYVADNSIFPVMGAANPTLTMVALAIRTADHIIRQSK